MPLNLFYTMVQKSQKWPKTQIKGGPALKELITVFLLQPNRLEQSGGLARGRVSSPQRTS